jgi:hypothetical protein
MATSHRDVLVQMPPLLTAEAAEPACETAAEAGRRWARAVAWLPATRRSEAAPVRLRALKLRLDRLLARIESLNDTPELSDDLRWAYENLRLVRATSSEVQPASASLVAVPHVRTPEKQIEPRVLAIAEDFWRTVEGRYSDDALSAYLQAFQEAMPLDMRELSLLAATLKVIALEDFATRAHTALERPSQSPQVGEAITSIRELSQAPWREVLEPLIVFDSVLAQDPANAYARMDYASRELYRHTVVHYAEHSDCSELQIAQMALRMAQDATKPVAQPTRRSAEESTHDARLTWRRSHVGYYLIGEGGVQLRARAGVRLPFGERVQEFVRRNAEEYYLGGIELLTLLIVIAIMSPVFGAFNSFLGRIFAIVLLLLPASQAAVEVMNYLTTALLRPRILPKLDFSEGVPDDCVTMVAVPTLLLSEKQVRRLVDELEIRYLGNNSRNLHYALLTDFPDSPESPNEDDPLVELASQLIGELNDKYAANGAGSFLLFHRHRVYNPREGVWMGWERKRGKLLDFNRLIKGKYDSFPVKIGDMTLLPHVRFVLTLDSDTELPRGTAHRLVGAMAHPLNQAIVDPNDNIVVAGYGILQPRVGISVQSASQSRLANIYSGQTGFDIYTRAISDVYQDLRGEGIFTGKGIYEVDTLSQVLEHRFPRNALLSHDLIEGAYARAGLMSDVEVIDDYPSHYSAYNRRKHRWLRGDWQIVTWLFGHVPDETGRKVRNPISFLSRWKIFDNLRRSLIEPAFFLLFVLGWTALPGKPVYWTLVTIAILFVPPWFQFAFSVIRALIGRRFRPIGDAVAGLVRAIFNVGLTLIFLAHQALISFDAVLRTYYRRLVSRQRLLEWETAAQAELESGRRTFVDVLLNWTPLVALAVGVLVYLVRRPAIFDALPVLFLWAISKPVSLWLNRPPRPVHKDVSDGDRRLLRRTALYIWRFYATFSNAEHNWLVPDTVQEEPPRIAAQVSPTNLGFLLNARQVALEFGYLTVPQFVEHTARTLATVGRMTKHRGHLYNWYDTRTLEPMHPRFVSTVDSGNFAASLLTLKGGCQALLERPLLNRELLDGYADHMQELAELDVISRRAARGFENGASEPWLERLLSPIEIPLVPGKKGARAADADWFAEQATALTNAVRQTIAAYFPWILPEFSALQNDVALAAHLNCEDVTVGRLPECIEQLRIKIEVSISLGMENLELRKALLAQLLKARANARQLVAGLHEMASQCDRLVRDMDFAFLLDRRRKLLSIGYDGESGKVNAACYDLLASEARIAAFVAVAKDDIPQESWFLMGRSHTVVDGRPMLVSWTGTMFEYLMPMLWLRSYPQTLLDATQQAAVNAQQMYGEDKRVPWGISECAYAKLEESGAYAYRAFGVPQLAVQQDEERLVVAPYATMLALPIDPGEAISNLNWMSRKGWFGAYGYYEAADFTRDARLSLRKRFVLVRSWMAHHQGMGLLAIANLLKNDVVQQWFRRDARVQATELLLQERPVAHASARPRKSRSQAKRKAAA